MSAELGTLSRSEAELTDANLHLKAKVDGVREELRGARAQAERSQHEAERYIKRYLDTPAPPLKCHQNTLDQEKNVYLRALGGQVTTIVIKRLCVFLPCVVLLAGGWRRVRSSGWRRNTSCKRDKPSWMRNTPSSRRK